MKTLLRRVAFLSAFGAAQLTARAAIVSGNAVERGTNITHPNGHVYDQVLMTGTNATVQADPGEVVRVSFIDLNDDIVQVEFSGSGSVNINLEAATGPAAPVRYNQPDVQYMKGHALIEIRDSDASTNITIFSVGTLTATNPALFRAGEPYDGVADVGLLTIVGNPDNPNGSTFGAIRAGNVQFWRTHGDTGIVAPRVQVQDAIIIHDVWALDDATPVLSFGASSQFGSLRIAGGDLVQPNGRPIVLGGYLNAFSPSDGTTSHNIRLLAQTLRAEARLLDGSLIKIFVPSEPAFVFPGTG